MSINLKLSPESMNVLAMALRELPYRISAPVIADIQQQVAAQQVPTEMQVKMPATAERE